VTPCVHAGQSTRAGAVTIGSSNVVTLTVTDLLGCDLGFLLYVHLIPL
jgi:hypothetical protein